jgi:hypothetical protein
VCQNVGQGKRLGSSFKQPHDFRPRQCLEMQIETDDSRPTAYAFAGFHPWIGG